MRIILVTWKEQKELEVYSSLKAFSDNHTEYSYNTLQNYLSRLDKPYEDANVKVERLNVIRK